jgi:hypothetical protein
MKATKYNGITYQLDESKFKPAYIKFDQDMFDDEIYPVLVGFEFEVKSTTMTNFLVNNARFLVNNAREHKFNFSVFGAIDFLYQRTQCHTATEFLNASGIFAVAEELPKDWYIEVTEDNLEELDAWRKSVASECTNHLLEVGYFILSKHYGDESYYYGNVNEHYLLEDHPNHKEIDLETFRKITNMKPDFSIKGTKLPSIPKETVYRVCHSSYEGELGSNYKTLVSYGLKEFKGETYVLADINDYKGSNYFMFKLSDIERLWKEQNPKQDMKKSFTITAEQAQSIINIACGTWKKQLAEKWANNIVLGDEIEVSEEFYKEMRAACTPPQNELFDKIFGKKDDGSVDLSMLNKSGIDSTTHGMIQVRAGSEHRNKAFFLSGGFNWEIKEDSEGLLCLIPTKKK